ncbi:hypothetical protein Taro_042457, partial [Colocasia esculenta]|nr:hypothetical protein [Colocasia esculenta]
ERLHTTDRGYWSKASWGLLGGSGSGPSEESFHSHSDRPMAPAGEEGREEEANPGGNPTFPTEEHRSKVICQHGGFWVLPFWLPGTLAAQRRLVTRPDDIFIATCPKSGTTWLKALVFSVAHRHLHRPSDPRHPLRNTSPHDCVPFLEEVFATDPDPNLEALPSPRIWSVHTPYSALPAAVRDSGCRIVYVTRDPKDVCVSLFYMAKTVEYYAAKIPLTMDKFFGLFCQGIHLYGPIWEHALEYWNESLRRPGEVLFLAYEEMKKDPLRSLRKLAEFLGRPFSAEEEREGLVEEISELCSFRSLTGLAVNKEGLLERFTSIPLPRNSFFRRGEVGDWRNHLSPEMAARLDKITEEKLRGTGNHRMGLTQHDGFWIPNFWLQGMLVARSRYAARPDDIFVASTHKSGTTWLKALVISITQRRSHSPRDPRHPLRTANPHDCIPFLEEIFTADEDPDVDGLPSPRIWSVHTPYSALPESARSSGCRIVYIIRDPKDVFVSYFRFAHAVAKASKVAPVNMDEAFELFCTGVYPFGPIWEHALEYWNESLRRPDKVLFLQYEMMKGEPLGAVNRLAAFLGCPFSVEEEKEGLVEEISELCSFQSLSSLEVNKEGDLETLKSVSVPRRSFFRVGQVGDWKNHLSPAMAERLDMITEEKLRGTGLKLS